MIQDLGTAQWLFLHVIDTVGVVHAIILQDPGAAAAGADAGAVGRALRGGQAGAA